MAGGCVCSGFDYCLELFVADLFGLEEAAAAACLDEFQVFVFHDVFGIMGYV